MRTHDPHREIGFDALIEGGVRIPAAERLCPRATGRCAGTSRPARRIENRPERHALGNFTFGKAARSPQVIAQERNIVARDLPPRPRRVGKVKSRS